MIDLQSPEYMQQVSEAERAVLGAILIDPDSFHTVQGKFSGNKVFHYGSHAVLWRAFCRIVEEGGTIDLLTATDAMEQVGDAPDPSFVAGLTLDVPSSLHVEHYADIVLRHYRTRILQEAGLRILQSVGDGDPIEEIVDRAIMDLSDSTGIGSTVHSAREVVSKAIDQISVMSDARASGGQVGVMTGIKDLDRILGGLRGTDYAILAGRPGMGKTTLGLFIALNIARDQGLDVLVYSLEMSPEELTKKLLSMISGIDYHDLRIGDLKDQEWPQLMEAADLLSRLPIYFPPSPGSVADIESGVKRHAAKYGTPGLVLLDYIQLMEVKGPSRNEAVGELSRRLKLLAGKVGSPVLALSQLSRAVEGRSDKRPFLSDLRDSGSLEQDADFILFPFRPGYYDETCETPNAMDLIVAKNRHGDTGTVGLYFERKSGTFKPLEVVRQPLFP